MKPLQLVEARITELRSEIMPKIESKISTQKKRLEDKLNETERRETECIMRHYNSQLNFLLSILRLNLSIRHYILTGERRVQNV